MTPECTSHYICDKGVYYVTIVNWINGTLRIFQYVGFYDDVWGRNTKSLTTHNPFYSPKRSMKCYVIHWCDIRTLISSRFGARLRIVLLRVLLLQKPHLMVISVNLAIITKACIKEIVLWHGMVCLKTV